MANSILAVKWERFFVDVGIPDKIAAEYAKKFAEQRVQFEMRGELNKSFLVELGIKALGDQMAVLHFLKKEKERGLDEMDANESLLVPSSVTIKQENDQLDVKKRLKAPDRDDIYHVRMPSGSTPKTREILKKQNLLRSAGLMKRGMNGVRKSGEEIRPASKTMLSRLGNGSTSSAEVSSTTHEVYERLGVRGLVSDSMPEPKIYASTVSSAGGLRYQQRKKVVDPAALFKRSINETAAFEGKEPVFRVRIPVVNRPSGSNIRIQETVSRIPLSSTIKARVHSKTFRINSFGRVQKRLPIQSRLTLGSNHGGLKRRPKGSVSVFDRLG